MAKAALKPRRIRSEEDRNKGRGAFLTLKKVNDRFVGYALFVADPARDDNPGYYEYFEHYTPATSYCPCVADPENDVECPLCDIGDNPSTRAKSIWLVVDADDPDPEKGEIKIFNLNYYVIQDFAEDGEKALGRLYSVKRAEGQGKYVIRPKDEKLTKTQLKAALKELPDLEKITTAQAAKVHEELDTEEAMTQDENEEGDEEPKTKSKSSKSKEKEEPTAFDPDEDTEFEDLELTLTKIVKKNNNAEVKDEDDNEFTIWGTDEIDLTVFEKGEIVTVSAEKDKDGDFVISSIERATEPEDKSKLDSEEVPASLDGVYEVVATDSQEETLTVKDDDGNEHVIWFFGEGEDDNGKEWSDLDLDDYSEGKMVKVVANKDDDGDLVASVFPEIQKNKGAKSGGKKTAGRK